MADVIALYAEPTDEPDEPESDEPEQPRYDIWNPDVVPELPRGWQDKGACLGIDPDLFFPARREGPNNARKFVQECRSICMSCPVQEECRTYALLIRTKFGIWGNTTPQERKRHLRPHYGPRWIQCTNCGGMRFGLPAISECCGNERLARYGTQEKIPNDAPVVNKDDEDDEDDEDSDDMDDNLDD